MRHDQTGQVAPSGAVAMAVERDLGDLNARQAPSLWWRVNNFFRHRLRELPALAVYRLLGRVFGLVWLESALRLELHRADGTIVDYGIVSRRVVTDVGVQFIVDAFQNLTELENMKYHGFGTGGAAEAAGNTALTTELTTQYVADNTRPTGTTTEGGTGNVYRTVATLSPDSGGTLAITEHGVFSAASAGVLLDRSLFAAVNVVAASDSLAATYDLTLNSGS
jgi:hypothetical protein